MESEDPKSIYDEFEAAFIFPFAKYSWKSISARSAWIDLELWQDALAGPVWNVVKHGNCAYVYTLNDEFFIGIDDPTSLRIRLREWHLKLTAGLDGFVPTTEAEVTDFKAMREFIVEMWAVAEKAIEIERLRWTREQPDMQSSSS